MHHRLGFSTSLSPRIRQHYIDRKRLKDTGIVLHAISTDPLFALAIRLERLLSSAFETTQRSIRVTLPSVAWCLTPRSPTPTVAPPHYGAGAPSLAASRDEIQFEYDRPSGKGVSVVYQVRSGRVTVASLTGRRGSYRMLIAQGETIRAKEAFHGGVVANVRFRANHREVLQKARGMSHHWSGS
jgi:hypothetical protein